MINIIKKKGCIKTRWTPASLPPATVKWTIVGRISAAVLFSFQKWQISLRRKCTPILSNPNENKNRCYSLVFFNIVQINTLIPIFGLLTLLAVFNELFQNHLVRWNVFCIAR